MTAEYMETNPAFSGASRIAVRRRLEPAALILWSLVLFHAVTSIFWLALDQRLVNWDPSRHLRNSLGAWQVLTNPGPDMLQRLSNATDVYEPPVAYLVTQPLYALFGRTADVAALTNVVFLGILIFATYGIGKLLYSQWTGLVAAFMVSFYPLVAAYTRIYYTDLGLAAIVAANLYFLLRSDNFLDRRKSFFFGLTLAIGLLTKKAFVLFAAGPFVLIVLQTLFSVRHDGKLRNLRLSLRSQLSQRLVNMTGAVLLGGLLALPWYLDHFDFIIRQADAMEEGSVDIPLTWYLTWLDDNLFLFGLLLFLVGSSWAFIRRDRRALFPLVWFGTSFVLHSLIQRGHTRYLLPLFPSIAILSAWWIIELRRVEIRRLLLFVTVMVFFTNYVVFTWFDSTELSPRLGFDPAPPLQRPMERLHNSSLLTIPKAVFHAYPPQDMAWPLDEVLDVVWQDSLETGGADNRRITIFVVGNVSGFNRGMLSYFAMQREIQSKGEQSFLVRGGGADNLSVRQILDFPYILVKTDVIGYGMQDYQTIVANALRMKPVRYAEIASFALPDSTSAILFKRIKPRLADLAAQGQFEQLASILELSPDDPQLRQFLADAYVQANQMEQAQPVLESLLQDAQSAADLIKVGDLYRQQGELEQAEQQYRQATVLDPSSPRSWLALGQLYQQQQRWQEAEEVYKSAIDQAPNNPDIWRDLGNTYYKSQQDEQAIRAYQKALELAPNRQSVRVRLSQSYEKIGRPEQAVALWLQALDIAPENSQSWRILADLYRSMGRIDEAIAAYEMALVHDPANIASHTVLAQIYQRRGDCELALTHLAARARLRNTVDDYAALGTAYRDCGNPTQALLAYQEAITLEPKSASLHFDLAMTYQEAGMLGEAIDAWQAVIDIAPDSDLAERAGELMAGYQ